MENRLQPRKKENRPVQQCRITVVKLDKNNIFTAGKTARAPSRGLARKMKKKVNQLNSKMNRKKATTNKTIMDTIEMIAGILIFIFILIPDWKEVIIRLANNISSTDSIGLILIGAILCPLICLMVLKREGIFTLRLWILKSIILSLLALVVAIMYVYVIGWAIDGYISENFWHYVIVYYVLAILGGGACDLLDPSSFRRG